MSWVLQHSSTRGNDRLVLLAIANHADADGANSYPSLESLAREARCSRSTVQMCIGRLVSEGGLTVEPSAGLSRGGRPTNRYTLAMDVPSSGTKPGPFAPDTRYKGPPLSTGSQEPDSEVEPGLSTDSSVRNHPEDLDPKPVQEHTQRARENTAMVVDQFAKFWTAYPRRTGKGAAQVRFAKRVAAGADPSELVEAAYRYAAWCAEVEQPERFVPHPATWLNELRDQDVLTDPATFNRDNRAPPQRTRGADGLAEYRRKRGLA